MYTNETVPYPRLAAIVARILARHQREQEEAMMRTVEEATE